MSLVECPNDLVKQIKRKIHNDSDLLSFGSTSHHFRHLILADFLECPYFRTPTHLDSFSTLFFPHYRHLVSCLFCISQPNKESVDIATNLLRECKDTLKDLRMDDLPANWKGRIVQMVREEGFRSLKSVVVSLEEEEEPDVWKDLLGCLPDSVKKLSVLCMRVADFRLIGENVQWLESLKVEFSDLEMCAWSEEGVRDAVRYFLDQNVKLGSVSNVIYYEREFGLIDWVFLDECFSRGITLKGNRELRCSWKSFKFLPGSITLTKVVNMFKKSKWNILGWKFTGDNRAGLLNQKVETYLLLEKEFHIKELHLQFCGWYEEDIQFLEQMLIETVKKGNVRHLRFEIGEANSLLRESGIYKETLAAFLKSYNHLETLCLNVFSLLLLRNITLPKIPITLIVYSREIGNISHQDIKCLFNLPSIHFQTYENLKTIDNFSLLLDMLSINGRLPKIVIKEFYLLNTDIGSGDTKQVIEKYISEHVPLWNSNSDITIHVNKITLTNRRAKHL